MRIISKFHDYYDSAMAYGLDPARLYSRVPEMRTVDLRFWPGSRAVLPFPFRGYWGKSSPARSLTVGFCGRHFPVWVDSAWPLGAEEFSSHEKERRWRSQEEALGDPNGYSGRYFEEQRERERRAMIEHDVKVRQAPRDVRAFRALGCPIYVLAATGGFGYYGWAPKEVQVITNPRLANLGFERVLDPYSAFQAIATFLENELAMTEAGPDTVGGDEVVARSKGFDETSFRTAAPGQKKLNRKANRERKRTGG